MLSRCSRQRVVDHLEQDEALEIAHQLRAGAARTRSSFSPVLVEGVGDELLAESRVLERDFVLL